MAFGPPLWHLATLLALRVTTDSADALCPPLGPTKTAVHSRVGEVSGGDYEARYTVVRDPERGSKLVRLILTDESGTRLLLREIPLTHTSCSEAAQAIALILETYFQGSLGPGRERSSPATPEKDGSEGDRAPDGSSASGRTGGEGKTESGHVTESERSHTSRRAEAEPDVGRASPAPSVSLPAGHADEDGPFEDSRRDGAVRSSSAWELGVLTGLDDRATPRIGLGGRLRWGTDPFHGAVSLDALFPLMSHRLVEGSMQLDLTSFSFFTGILASWSGGDWTLRVGPGMSLDIETASVTAEDVDSEGTRPRAVWGLGGQAHVAWVPWSGWKVEAGLRGGSRLSEATSPYVVTELSGAEREVLSPRPYFIAGSLGLFWTDFM